MANDRADVPLAVSKNPFGLPDDDYREAVQNIRTFFTLLDSWYLGLDATNRPGYDELRDNEIKED